MPKFRQLALGDEIGERFAHFVRQAVSVHQHVHDRFADFGDGREAVNGSPPFGKGFRVYLQGCLVDGLLPHAHRGLPCHDQEKVNAVQRVILLVDPFEQLSHGAIV